MRGPFLFVWADSCSHGDHWMSVQDIDFTETVCETVGWIVRENSHSVFVVSSRAPSEISGVMQIPRVAIRSRVKLYDKGR